MTTNFKGAIVFSIVQFSNTPLIKFRVSSVDGANLTGGSVTFRMMAPDGTLKIEAAATITGENNAEYEWQAGDTDVFGTYWWRIECTLSNGKTLTGPVPWGQINIVPAIRAGIVVP